MTSKLSVDDKEIVFYPESVRDEFMNLPPKVREIAINRLTLIQNNVRLPDRQVRRIEAVPGTAEIRVDFDGMPYRIYHTHCFKEAVFIIQAHAKKPTKGVGAPKADMDRLLTRLKALRVHYDQDRPSYERRHEWRMRRAEAITRKRNDDAAAAPAAHGL